MRQKNTQINAALAAGKRACTLTPNDPQAWLDLGRLYALLSEWDDAAHCFNQAIDIDVKLADAWHNLGIVCNKLDQRDLAFTAFKNALLIDNTRADSYLSLGTLLSQLGQFDDALECFERAVQHDPTLVSARSQWAGQLSEQGQLKQAESLFRQSLAMDPDHIEGWMGLGRALEDTGEAEGALAAYGNVLKRRPDHAMALCSYLSLLPPASEPEALATVPAPVAEEALLSFVETSLADKQVADEAKALIAYGLTQYHHRRQQYAAAARFGVLANNARRRAAGVLDRKALAKRIDRMIETYSADFFSQHRRLGLSSEQPVLIVGLPRSGTTLTEQILAAHPRLHGAGELPDLGRLAESVLNDKSALWQAAAVLAASDRGEQVSHELAESYLKALRAGASEERLRISDKSPLNFFQLAFVALIFPRAKIIHCQRDARDNALSIWMANFDPSQPWSTDFDDLVFYRQQYQRLMNHWQAHLPLPILEMPYEDTVADLEGQAKRMMDFLNVPWDQRCLDFHQHQRAVQTPSRWQVRQPIYTGSVGRWRAYQPFLPALETAF